MGSLRDENLLAKDFSSINFIELDRLFEKSSRALKRKKRKQRERGGRSQSRSGSPQHKKSNAPGVGGYAGFSSKIGCIEKTIVVTSVPADADERILFAHFSTCGTVEDVMITRNRHGTPTGVAIVEFALEEAVLRACSLLPPYNTIMGVLVQMKRADSAMTVSALAKHRQLKQLEQAAPAPLPVDPSLANAKKLHITNLRSIVTEEDMRGIFKPFGTIDRIQMAKEECWITFINTSDARDAMGSMQSFSLVGQELRIALVGPDSGMPALTNRADPNSIERDTDFGATKRDKDADAATERLKLMAKLIDSRGQPFTPGAVPNIIDMTKGWPPVPPPARPGGPQTRTLLLQNMFNSKEVDLVKEPKFFHEIKEDTEEEVKKFGKVLHIVVDPRGGVGSIYVCFDQTSMRDAAVNALNGRWFEGKKITAMAIDDAIWQALQAQLSNATGGATPAPQVPMVQQPGMVKSS